jgi:hypothetical protein
MNMTQAIAAAQLAQLQVLTARLRTPRPHTLVWLCASATRRNMYHVVTYDTYALTWRCDCLARTCCTHIGAAATFSAQAARAAAAPVPADMALEVAEEEQIVQLLVEEVEQLERLETTEQRQLPEVLNLLEETEERGINLVETVQVLQMAGVVEEEGLPLLLYQERHTSLQEAVVHLVT